MYLSAACLIGLHPLLAVTSQWLKKRVVTWRRTGGRTDYKKDRDSMSHSLKEDVRGGVRLQSFGRDMELGRDNSTGSSDNVLVRSELQATSTGQYKSASTPRASNIR